MPFETRLDSPGDDLSQNLFGGGVRFLRIALALVFLLGVAIRLFYLPEPGVVPDRQFRSYLIARAYFFESRDDISQWRKDVAITSSQRQEALEPQIMERIVAMIYRLINAERFWVARLVASSFWLVSAIPLYFLARRIGSEESAVITTGYYLLVPFGILMSLSFLPEALMLLIFLFSLLCMVRYFENPSGARFIVAAAVSGLAILIKPFVLFTIVGAFAALAIQRKGNFKALFDTPFVAFCFLSVSPGAVFYGYGILGAEYLRWKVEASFLPHFLLSQTYWEGWFITAVNAVGFTALMIALFGVPIMRKGQPRALLLGLGTGYVGFCLFFNYYAHFATYYHTQLIVIVALAIGPILTLLTSQLRRLCVRWYDWAPVSFAVLCILFFTLRAVSQGQVYPPLEGRKVAYEIGNLVNHSTRVAYLAYVYGLPLEYYGELAGEYWPRAKRSWPLRRSGEQNRSIEERMSALGFLPEYFVVTQFNEYTRNHRDLREFLESNATLVAESEKYLIYSLPAGLYQN
jgi:hypothetical protein